MDEAKTLVHLSISTIFSAIFLAVCVGLISTGAILWSLFSRQDATNEAMHNYARYAAFDNTTIRGQEMLQLVESSDDIFVICLEGRRAGSSTDLNNMTIDNNDDSIYVKLPALQSAREYDFTDTQFRVNNTNATLQRAQQFCKAQIGQPIYRGMHLNGMSHDDLVSLFTTTHTSTHLGLGKPDYDPATGTILNSGTYAAYKVMLVYDTDSTSDVVGIVGVREAPGTTSY